jgi:hypothetical protein
MRVRSELTAPLVALSAVLLFPGPARSPTGSRRRPSPPYA